MGFYFISIKAAPPEQWKGAEREREREREREKKKKKKKKKKTKKMKSGEKIIERRKEKKGRDGAFD